MSEEDLKNEIPEADTEEILDQVSDKLPQGEGELRDNISDEKEALEEEDIEEKEADSEISDNASVVQSDPPRRFRAPLMIAFGILLCSVLFFVGLGMFCPSDFNGTWGIELKTSDDGQPLRFNFTFNRDNTLKFQSGGSSYLGSYSTKNENGSLIKDDEGNNVVNISVLKNGLEEKYRFNYSFKGNIITGKTLEMTDLDGLFLSPDSKSADEETIKRHKKMTDSVTKGDSIYYIWSFRPSEVNYYVKKNEGFKPDDQLLFTWIHSNAQSDYSYTIRFNKDGTFDEYSYDFEVHGTYKINNGKCTIQFYDLGNENKEVELDYSVNDDKLDLNGIEFTKTEKTDDYLKNAKDNSNNSKGE